jgi:uncharacterized membrane protein YbjE (DUF340 family)
LLGFTCTMGSALAAHTAQKFFPQEANARHSGPGSPGKGMYGSLIILGCFVAGIFTALLGLLPPGARSGDISMYILLTMLCFVGTGIGFDLGSLRIVRYFWPHALLIPLLTIAGTTLGACLSALFLDLDARSCLTVGYGFGYYSLASAVTTEMAGAALGSVSLLANIFRELFCLLATPALARFLGPLSVVAAAAAPATDTCLPVITHFTGERYAIIAVFNGLVITIAVPFFIPLTLKLF